MITGIQLKRTATYDSIGADFDDLRAVNYIYGENGSGKTTFSNFINNSKQYPECQISWKNGVPMRALVYNKSFVEENFHQHARLKGIFTLGKESHDIREQIRQTTEVIEKVSEELTGLTNNLNQKKRERDDNETDYGDKCWALKQKYDEDFKEAFKGYRSVKSKFTEKCKSEFVNQSNVVNHEELKTRYDRVFVSSLEKVNSSFSRIDAATVLTTVSNSIFTERIIGKEDIDIAGLINRLNISDWVRQGHQHLKKTNGICPFCQQTTSQGLEEKLDAYFDESYNEHIKQLSLASERYTNVLGEVFRLIDEMLSLDSDYLDNSSVKKRVRADLCLFTITITVAQVPLWESLKSIHTTLQGDGSSSGKLPDCPTMAEKSPCIIIHASSRRLWDIHRRM